jgi:hypothetical protein
MAASTELCAKLHHLVIQSADTSRSRFINAFQAQDQHEPKGAEVTSFDYIKCAFGLKGPWHHLITETYIYDEIEYIVLQTSQPQRNTYYYDCTNSYGSVHKCEFRTYSPETHDKFYKYLEEEKKCTVDEWYAEHCKDWFQKIKQELQFYESKGIKTLILNWETDYIPFYKDDEWMNDRLITFEYNENKYDTIRTMMNENRHLHINSDLVIGSLSITAYERLFLNIPQISVKIVENQLIQQLDEFNIVSLDNLMNKILEFPKKILIKNKINYPKLSIFD